MKLNQQHITYFKYRVINKKTEEEKYFFKFNELKEYTGCPRSTLYRIFKGECESKWCRDFYFEKVRLPRLQLKEIDYVSQDLPLQTNSSSDNSSDEELILE